MAVQWLGLHASTAGGLGSIRGRGIKIPHATLRSQKKRGVCVFSLTTAFNHAFKSPFPYP